MHRHHTEHQEQRLGEEIGQRLAAQGIRFAGIDLAYPYVFEANLVNPGGLDERLDPGSLSRTEPRRAPPGPVGGHAPPVRAHTVSVGAAGPRKSA